MKLNKEKLDYAITNIDDKYICEALKYQKTKKKNFIILKRIGTIAACLLLTFVVSLSSLWGASAAGSMTAYDMLYSLYPDIASKLLPINISCEDNGIEMKVKSIYVHENKADIYISLTDLKENRIDETTDLFDSYSINTACDQIGGCQLVNFDAASKTATFLINVEHSRGKKITGKNMKFSVSKFLSGKKEVTKEIPEISTTNIPNPSKVQTNVKLRGAAGIDSLSSHTYKLLYPDSGQNLSLMNEVNLTSYGFIDNKLHIQVYYKDIKNYDNHGFIYLKDASGNKINPSSNLAFWGNDNIGSYEEYIFDIGPNDDLSAYSMWGDFVTCNSLTEGNWEVSFPIENTK